jgi:hypothetical protein
MAVGVKSPLRGHQMLILDHDYNTLDDMPKMLHREEGFWENGLEWKQPQGSVSESNLDWVVI